MQKTTIKSILASAFVLILGVVATSFVSSASITEIITPGDVSNAPGFWHPANERDGGMSAITSDQPDSQTGNGSLDQYLPAPASNSPKTDFELFSADAFDPAPAGFGLVNDRSAMSFEWYRDSSSSAPAHLTPAFRTYVYDPDWPDGPSSFLLVWEGVYNGYPSPTPVPVDTWVSEDVVSDYFWRIPQYINGVWKGIGGCSGSTTASDWSACYVFNNTLDDWTFSSNAVFVGLNVGLGSGWSGSYQGYADFVTLGFTSGDTITYDFEVSTVSLDPDDSLEVCDTGSVAINFGTVSGLYGYEFKVDYDDSKLSATGNWVDSWFDTTLGFSPPLWDAVCDAGTCLFAVTLQHPAAAVDGSGTVASIGLTALDAGVTDLTIYDVVLSDIDGFAIPVDIADDTVEVTSCGTATVSGVISLQGRLTPINSGTVTLTDPSSMFGPYSATFNATTGAYTIAGVKYLPGGTVYDFSAAHYLYLTNEKSESISGNLTGQNTRLLGGDADNSGVVNIIDLSCIGGDFGGAPDLCGADPNSSTDINADSLINIQDLTIAGGNFQKASPQPWN